MKPKNSFLFSVSDNMQVNITRDGFLNGAPVRKWESWNIADHLFNAAFMEEVKAKTKEKAKETELSDPVEEKDTPKDDKPKKSK